MPKISTKISRLIVESENDSIIGDAIVLKPKKDMGEQLGSVLAIIELIDLPNDIVDKFLDIIADLKTEYYLPPFNLEEGLEKRFEDLLQRANRRIYKAANESVERIDLKNINILVGLIHKNKIYLSQIGQVNAFLFHRKKRHDYAIIDILSETGNKKQKINPEKMFSNIISGAITLKDNLLFSNDSILQYLSQSEIMEIVAENSSLAAVKTLEETLSQQSDDDNFYAIIIQPETDEEEPPMATGKKSVVRERHDDIDIPSQKSINNLIDTQSKTEEYLTPSLMPSWKKTLFLIWIGIKITIRFIFKYLKIIFVYLFVKIKEFSIRGRKNLPKAIKATQKASSELISEPKGFAQKFSQKSWKAAKTTVQKTTDLENYKKMMPLDRQGGGFLQQLSNWLNRQISKFVSLNRFYQILVIVVFILFFFFAQSIVWQGRGQTTAVKNDTQQLIEEVEENINTAEAQNIFNDEEAAKASLAAATEGLDQIPDKKKYKSIREELQGRIDQIAKLLQKISYLENLEVVADLSSRNDQAQTSGLAKIGNLLLVYDNQNQNMYKIDLENKQILASQLNSSLNNIRKIKTISDNGVIILNNDNEFYQYNLEKNSAEQILITDSPVESFDIYGDKLYTIQPEKNQIFKHLPSGAGFNTGSQWVKDNSDVKTVSAMAIDGGIYTINNNGEIDYLLSGRIDNTNMPVVEPALNTPADAYSDIESNYLFILDQNNNRIVIFDKRGHLKTQYTSKDFNNMKSMVVVEVEKKIYLLSDNKVYLVEIDF